MTWRRKCRLLAGCAVMLTIPLLAAAQEEAPDATDVRMAAGASARVFEDEGKIRDVWDVYESLADRDRMFLALRSARGLLQEADADLPDDVWQDTYDALHNFDYPDHRLDDTEFGLAEGDVASALDTIQSRLLMVVPRAAAFDYPDDDGLKLIVVWKQDQRAGSYKVERQQVMGEADEEAGEWETLAVAPAADRRLEDDKNLRIGKRYRYRVTVLPAADGETPADAGPLATLTTNVTQTRGGWFHSRKIPFFVFMLVICGAVVFYIEQVRSGKDIYIRKIAGLEAVDEAVGRATEMGRPIMFVPGIQDITDIQTIAGLIILGRVAKTAAEHDAMLEVPTSRSLVMTTAREIVKTSYDNAGRPDAYSDKQIYYTTDEQFGYVAAVTGAMVRKRPATCFYMGAFYAESLILAETANETGAIQIAGTAMPAQLPFFVAACDYTLIGEEFFAASAYLSGEPHQLGSLKGQDIGKIIVALFIVVGVLLSTMVMLGEAKYSWVGAVLDFVRNNLLEVAE